MKTILVADDNRKNRYLLEVLLQGNGMRVLSVGDGKEALELARSEHPDLIISDILMPVMDGWSLCRALRADASISAIPFIFYTATYTDSKDEEFSLKIGADRFITKPQEPQMLMETINDILKTSPSSEKKGMQGTEKLQTEYSEALFKKLQKKIDDLEQANLALKTTISELRHAKDELSILHAAVSAIPTSVIITDVHGKIEWVNEAFSTNSGYTATEVIGQNPKVLKSGQQAPEFYASMWQTITQGNVWRGELINKRKDGKLFTEEAIISPVRDSDGIITHYIALKTNITDKRQLEAQLLRAQRMESIGMLAAGIAHDLNNVLAPVLMVAPVLRDRVKDREALSLLATVESSAARGGRLVHQILDFAKGVSGDPQSVDIVHLVSDVSEMINQTFPKSIAIEHSLSSELSSVNVVPSQLHQVILNLCVNARDAMPKGGTLRIKAKNIWIGADDSRLPRGVKGGAWVCLSVQDTGTGIPKDLLEQIWSPFFSTKPAGKGTGLGLPTVRGIIETHHGFVTVDSIVGQGTTFSVYLPAETQATAPQEQTAAAPTVKGAGELILVIDDEETIRQAVSMALIHRGYHVLTASDGNEALKIFKEKINSLSLVITDLEMPNAGGGSFINDAHHLKSSIPILVISGGERDKSVTEIPETAIRAYLQKPFSILELLNEVRKLLPGS